MTDEQRSFLETFITAWNRHDTEGIAVLYAEDAIMEDSGLFDGRLEGREAIRDYYVRQWQQTPSGEEQVHSVAANDSQLFVEWEWFPGGGYDFSARGVSIWTLKHGVMTSDVTYFNPTEMRRRGLEPEFVERG